MSGQDCDGTCCHAPMRSLLTEALGTILTISGTGRQITLRASEPFPFRVQPDPGMAHKISSQSNSGLTQGRVRWFAFSWAVCLLFRASALFGSMRRLHRLRSPPPVLYRRHPPWRTQLAHPDHSLDESACCRTRLLYASWARP